MSPTAGSNNGSCLHQGSHLRRRQPPKHLRILRKCYSESQLSDPDTSSNKADHQTSDTHESGRCFLRFDTFTDRLCSSPLTGIYEGPGYEKNSKVLITVTVEGSPGPLRIVIKLGTSVEECIKLVIKKYDEEGRTPRLPSRDAASHFDLHLSYFTLHCLERSDAIGETGNRSFYLRKSTNIISKSTTTTHGITHTPDPPTNIMLLFFPPIMAQNITKFLRRIKKLFKLLGCLDST